MCSSSLQRPVFSPVPSPFACDATRPARVRGGHGARVVSTQARRLLPGGHGVVLEKGADVVCLDLAAARAAVLVLGRIRHYSYTVGALPLVYRRLKSGLVEGVDVGRRHVLEEYLGREPSEIQVGMMSLELGPHTLEAVDLRAREAGLVSGIQDVGRDAIIGRGVVDLRGRGVTSGSGAFLRLVDA